MTRARSSSWVEERTADFHLHSAFCAIWLLVCMSGIYTMSKLRPVLEPLIWAFFLMMALLPLCDFIEWCLLSVCRVPMRLFNNRQSKALEVGADGLRRQYTGLDNDSNGDGQAAQSARMSLSESDDDYSSSAADEPSARAARPISKEPSGASWGRVEHFGRGLTRLVAVLTTFALFLGGAMLFVQMIYHSAYQMQQVWPHYTDGANRMATRANDFKTSWDLPKEVAHKVTKNGLQCMQEVLSFLAESVFQHITTGLFDIFMTLLYMAFWLCQPITISATTTRLFKRYILLKTAASAMYALCIYAWLFFWKVDLAIVFGSIAFLFNFVPEVGTIASILLPAPVVLFDGRRERPVLELFLVFAGEFFLKFLFSNIVEVKLVEKQNDFRMHPVTILFFVAFFGAVWGPTGMLVSVPIMAAVKAGVQAIPNPYRDPILVFFEGSKDAPVRFELSRQTPHAD